MSSPRRALMPISLLSVYPVLSTFVMTLIWQIAQVYIPPFLGGYYYKWVFLYTQEHRDWLGESLLTQSRWYYLVYIVSYLLLCILTLLALFCRRGKAICAWGISLLWFADTGFILWNMVDSGVTWQGILNTVEHLIFLVWILLFSIGYLRLKKAHPEWFQRKKRRKKEYRRRFS